MHEVQLSKHCYGLKMDSSLFALGRQGHNPAVSKMNAKSETAKVPIENKGHANGGHYITGKATRKADGTIGGTRIVTLEVKLKDRRNTTLSESRCQVSLH